MSLANQFQSIAAKRIDAWIALSRRNVFISSSRGGATAFHRLDDLPAEAEQLVRTNTRPEALGVICDELAEAAFPHACLIDASRAARLLSEQGLPAAEAVRRSRVRYMGTDGIRGDTGALGDGETPLQAITERRRFTPELCKVFACSLIAADCPGKLTKVVIAEDGRDSFSGRRFIRAAIAGFVSSGCEVIDLGIAPTPLVPAAMAMLTAEYGAAITASHNPSNQNGIKLFRKCRKLLPEPDDYILSALAFKACLGKETESGGEGGIRETDPWPLLKKYMDSGFSQEDVSSLTGTSFIVDAAYGAFSPFVSQYMDAVGLHSETVNTEMTGDNINHFSGVAHVEGRDVIEEAAVADEVEVVRKTFAEKDRRDGAAFGIALDGDGDRGLLLVPDTDRVYILDGDKMGYIIAKYLKSRNRVGDRIFAGTVESDLCLFDAVAELGISSEITEVGDKWITSVQELAVNLLLGEESSGHLARPISLTSGSESTDVISGNGMLTCLWAALAIKKLGLTPRECSEPFVPGIMETLYTYFVDKSRFYRGSEVWQSDQEIAEQAVRRLVEEGSLPSETGVKRIDFEYDEDMLYLKLEAGSKTIGAVFVRNSGTENKTGAYARGLQAFAEPVIQIADALNRNHISLLKNRSLPENAAGNKVVSRVEELGEMDTDEALRILDSSGICGAANGNALLFALLKEKRIRRQGSLLVSAQSSKAKRV